MIGFALGAAFGFALAVILRRLPRNKGDRGILPRKKIDGIWQVSDERRTKAVDPSRPRVRKALILERTRRGINSREWTQKLP